MTNYIGKVINNKFKVLELLGEGGMSFVFKAMDLQKDSLVVIKFMKEKVTSSYVDDIIRFRREVEIVSKLDHENIMKICETGEFDGRPYLVMEYLVGESLEDNLYKGETFSENKAVQVIYQITEALDYAHGKGILHRDLKPGNIFIINDSGKIISKLLDFGIALLMELGEITEEREITGTFGYMSPETTGILNKRIDERSDLYSLGVIFYQLLSNEMPFKEKEINKLLHQQVAFVPQRPSKIKPGIPLLLEEICMKLLSKDPDLRYQSAKGLLFDIKRYILGDKNFVIGEKDQIVKFNFQTRLIGREDEYEKIKELFNKAQNDKGSVCLIAGEAGIGKSRLVEEIRGYVYEQGGLLIRGRCLNHENKTPYQPFKDATDDYIRQFEKIDKVVSNEDITRLKNILGSLGEVVLKLNPRMEKIIGEVKKLHTLEPDRENQRFLKALSEFFLNLTGSGKVCVLYLDDLQWSDDGSINLLLEILYTIDNSNLLVLGTYRDNEVDSEHCLSRFKKAAENLDSKISEIKLASLNHKKLNQLTANLLNEKEDKADELTKYILEKSNGNPFFTINIIKELIENNVLIWKDGFWEEDFEKISQIKLSNNIVEIIMKRIQVLNSEQNDILCKAAVIGREFEIDLLYKLVDIDKDKIVSLTDDIITMQLLERSQEKGRLLFAHDRIRDAFYHKIEEREKKRIHKDIAFAIEKYNNENKEAVIFDLAHHFVESGDKGKSLEYVIPAAVAAKSSYANEEAIKYFNLGIRLLEESGRKGSAEWIKSNEELIEVYLTVGMYDRAISMSDKILPLVDKPIDKAKLYRNLGLAYFKNGEWAKCEENLAASMNILGEKIPRNRIAVVISFIFELSKHIILSLQSDSLHKKVKKFIREEDKEIIRLYVTLNWMYVLNDTKKFVRSVLRALNLCETRHGKSSELALFLSAYAGACGVTGLFKRSIKYCKMALKMKMELGDEWGTAQTQQFMGHLYFFIGDYSKSIEVSEESSKKFHNMGDAWEQGVCYFALGTSYRYISEYNAAIDCFNGYMEVSESTKNSYGIASAQAQCALVFIETGDFLIAEELLRKSMLLSEKEKKWPLYCYALIHFGCLELEKGNYYRAVEILEKAKGIYESNKYIKDYTIRLYYLLADAYIKANSVSLEVSNKQREHNLKKIKSLCSKALRLIKPWANHYGAVLRVNAQYYAYVNNNNKAEMYFKKSIEQTQKLGRKYELAISYYEYGIFLKKLGRPGEALYNLYNAYEIFTKIGAKAYISKFTETIGKDLLLDTSVLKVSHNQSTARDRLKNERSLSTVLNTSRYISSILELEELLEKVMDNAMELVGAERGILLLYQEEGEKKLEVRSVRNVTKEEINSKEFNASMTIISRIEKEQIPLIVTDAMMDEKFKNQSSVLLNNIRSVLCSPIMTKGEMIGVLYLDNNLLSGLFNEDDMNILNLISNQAGVSIENARLYSRLTDYLVEIEESRDEIASWSQMLELRVNERTEQLGAANNELLIKNEQLKEHALTVVELALAEERNRLARDVHDTLGHSLSLLTKLLEACKISLGQDLSLVETKIDDAINISREGIKEVRRTVSGLVPMKLEIHNLYDAILGLVSEFELSGMNIDFTYDFDHNIVGQEISEAVFRVCQESLTNSLRHGKARNVTIAIKKADDKLKIFIVDDGLGFKELKKGFGLTNMEKRITDLNGSIVFTSDGEQGMYIMAEIPLKILRA